MLGPENKRERHNVTETVYTAWSLKREPDETYFYDELHFKFVHKLKAFSVFTFLTIKSNKSKINRVKENFSVGRC